MSFSIFIKVALYIRIPKIEDAQNTTKQIDELTNFANTNNWEIVTEIKDYLSGSKATTYNTKELINLAEINQIQKVLVYDIAQLGKNVNDTYHTLEALSKHNVSIFDYSQKQETLDDAGNNTIYAKTILPVFQQLSNQWKIEHSDKIKIGTKKAKKKGIKIGRPKQDKQKKEDEIIKLRKRGFISIEDGKKKKSSYSNIAEHLGVSLQTVQTICQKHHIDGIVSIKSFTEDSEFKAVCYITQPQSSCINEIYKKILNRNEAGFYDKETGQVKYHEHPDVYFVDSNQKGMEIGSFLKEFKVYPSINLKHKHVIVECLDFFTIAQQEVFLKYVEEAKMQFHFTASDILRIESKALLSRLQVIEYKEKPISHFIPEEKLKDLRGFKRYTSFANANILKVCRPIITNIQESFPEYEKELMDAIKGFEGRYATWYILQLVKEELLSVQTSTEHKCLYHTINIETMADLQHFLRIKYWHAKI